MENNNFTNPKNSTPENISGVSGSQEEHLEKTSKFINETSLDQMLEIAEIARRKKLTAPPKWVIPDDI